MDDILDSREIVQNNDVILTRMTLMGHEQVVFCQDRESGLKAIIAIHNTTLGPALGGTRMWNYKNEMEAINDVLRLSRGMTYKASISGLDLGGGKAVIIGNSYTDKSEALFRKFGEYVNRLGGNYITAEDVGISPADIEYVAMETPYVTGRPQSSGGSGDPSPVTAYGVYMGMKACAMEKWGKNSLVGKKVVVQGVGHVGEYLVEHLVKEGANVTINDIDEERVERVAKKFDAKIVKGDAVYDVDMDIYAPCALGATVNSHTLERLKCSIIAGAANNQLANEEIHGVQVMEQGILYAPDFLINAGGLINVNSEVHHYSSEKSMQMTENIYNTTLDILHKSKKENIPTYLAAMQIAEARIAEAAKSK